MGSSWSSLRPTRKRTTGAITSKIFMVRYLLYYETLNRHTLTSYSSLLGSHMISKHRCIELSSLLALQNGVIDNFFFALKLLLPFLEKSFNIDQLRYFLLVFSVLLILVSNIFSLFLNGRHIPLIPSTFPTLFNFFNLSGDDLIE